ncbi:MAG: TolC family protein [Candidatus Omnitrophota bacterium]
MRNNHIILLPFILLSPSLAYCDSQTSDYKTAVVEVSIDAITDIALANSLDIQIAKFDVLISRQSLPAAESIFDTVLNTKIGFEDDQTKPALATGATRTRVNTYSAGITKKLPSGTKLNLSADNTRTNSNSSAIAMRPQNEAGLNFSLTQSLGKNFFGFSDRADIEITKIDIENSDYTSLNMIEQTVGNVQIAYWDFVLKSETVAIKEDMLNKAKDLYSLYHRNFDLGLIEDVDLLAVESYMRERESDLLIARLDKTTAKNNLLFLIDSPDLSVELLPLDNLGMAVSFIDLNDALRGAIANRRDYRIINNKIKAQNLKVETKNNSLWPQIDLEATLSKNGIDSSYIDSWGDLIKEDNSSAYLGLKLTLPLENTLAKAQLTKADLEKDQLILKLKLTERLILKDIHNEVKEANALANQIELFSSIIKLHENKLKAEHQRLNAGRSTSDRIIRYEEDLLLVRLNLAAAFFKYRVSIINLALAQNSLLDKYWKGKL